MSLGVLDGYNDIKGENLTLNTPTLPINNNKLYHSSNVAF